MVNNIGKTTQKLSVELGRTTEFTSSEDINIIAGEIGVGFLLFDSDGTIGVISEIKEDHTLVVTTYALSIDIETILSLTY